MKSAGVQVQELTDALESVPDTGDARPALPFEVVKLTLSLSPQMLLMELATAWLRHGRRPCLRRELSLVLA